MNRGTFLILLGVLSLAVPAHAHRHVKHAKKRAVSFDRQVALIQHRIDLNARHYGSPMSLETLAEENHMPLSVVDELGDHMSWGQVAVYLAFANQISARNSNMSPADAIDPISRERKGGVAWHQIAEEYRVPKPVMLQSLASSRIARGPTETQLARRK